jgi:hypothetical protein
MGGMYSHSNQIKQFHVSKERKSPYEEFYGHEAKFAKNISLFGKVGINLCKLYDLPDKIAN